MISHWHMRMLLTTILLVVLLSSCDKFLSFHYRGEIFDQMTGDPVAGASVLIDPIYAGDTLAPHQLHDPVLTDTSGVYRDSREVIVAAGCGSRTSTDWVRLSVPVQIAKVGYVTLDTVFEESDMREINGVWHVLPIAITPISLKTMSNTPPSAP